MDGSGPIRTEHTILIVDDDVTQRLLTREALVQKGYLVLEEDRGDSGLEAARRHRPDLILLDILMPGMDGFEVCEAIRKDPDIAHTPVLLVTSLDDTNSIERGFEVGATDFIAKPIVWTLLGYRIRFALRAAAMEKDVRHERDRAETASRAKSLLLANMRHELRTPLNAIIGFSGHMRDLASANGETNPGNEFLDDIYFSGQRLLATVNDMLDMADLQSGLVELTEDETDLSRMVDDVVRRNIDKAVEKSISLDSMVLSSELNIRCDIEVMKRALGNLVSNAIKFTPEGGVYITALPQAGGSVEISITDTGIGMTAEELEAIFEPFGQADSSLARLNQGTGLGVPIAKTLIGLHGGRLEFESEPGTGTTATVILPASRVVTAGDVPSAALPQAG